MFKREYIFPLLIISCMVMATIIYLIKRDFARAVYWFSGALLNITVTFFIRG